MDGRSLKANQIQLNGPSILHGGLVNPEWQKLKQPGHGQPGTTSSEVISHALQQTAYRPLDKMSHWVT